MSPITGGGGGGDTFEKLTSNYYLYRNVNALSSSDFVATIQGFTGVAGEVKHNVPGSGDADYMTYNDGVNQLGMLVLHNTTRGNSGLVRSYVVATRMITLNGEVPADWQIGDTITLRSQTADTGGLPYCFDLDLSEFYPDEATTIYIQAGISSNPAASSLYTHPFEIYGAGKAFGMATQVANYTNVLVLPVPLTEKAICFRATANGANAISALWYRTIGYEAV